MVHDDDWYDDPLDDEVDSITNTAYDVPLYDEDGNEIPDDDLIWNAVPDETDPEDETDDWQYDDSDSVDSAEQSSEGAALQDERSAAERRKRITQSAREEALRRLELSARTTQDYMTIVSWYDRKEQSRMRKERRYESLRGDIPLEYGTLPEAEIVPHSMSRPTFRQICRGEYDDYLANCLFTMHDLTDKSYLRRIIYDLKLDQKRLFISSAYVYTRQRNWQRFAVRVNGTSEKCGILCEERFRRKRMIF